jgi:phosphatidylserine decarboxylase
MLTHYFAGDYHFIIVLGHLVSAFLLITILQFFRNPARKVIIDDNSIVAPADGKVVVIEETVENEYFKDKRLQISIFMSPVNVHANRYPIGGIVKYAKYHPGLFLVAWHPKSSTENERTTIVVEHKNGQEVLFRQIAGALARRIVFYSKEGDQAVQGAEFGFIKFGSRVDLLLPTTVKVKVNLEQKVTGNSTVIATFS